MPIAATIRRTLGNWSRRSSGIRVRVALYSAYCSWRKVGPCEVERDRDVPRPDVLEPSEHDAREAEHRVDEFAFARGERRKREIPAIDEPVPVEQHQAVHRVECTGDGAGHSAGAASLQAWRRPARLAGGRPEGASPRFGRVFGRGLPLREFGCRRSSPAGASPPRRRAISMTAVSPEYPPPRRCAPVVSVLPVRAVRRAELDESESSEASARAYRRHHRYSPQTGSARETRPDAAIARAGARSVG